MEYIDIINGRKIAQSDDYFKLCQDSVLLAAFTRMKKNERALDLGAGIGCIAVLMMARQTSAVDALELDGGAADLCRENYRINGFDTFSRVFTGDFRELPRELRGSYDICVCNPPYFDKNRGKISAHAAHAAARSNVSGELGDVCSAAASALKPGGRLYICIRPARLMPLLYALHARALEPRRLRLVHHAPGREAILALVEARLNGGEQLTVEPPLYVKDETGVYSAEYCSIYRTGMSGAPQGRAIE